MIELKKDWALLGRARANHAVSVANGSVAGSSARMAAKPAGE
jgi:hypothetical protein